jgi:cytochrome b pre-mRNA-processing protein 3
LPIVTPPPRPPCRQGHQHPISGKSKAAQVSPPAGATKLAFLQTLFGQRGERARLRPLYEAGVAIARDPAWYRNGGVGDTLEGRFAMVAAVTALVLLRLEAEGEAALDESRLLTELFIDDMDSSLREIGIGDFVVGKQVGKLVSALGGRLGAFRDAASFEEPVGRNIFAGAPADEADVRFVAARLEALRDRLRTVPLDRLLAGEIG